MSRPEYIDKMSPEEKKALEEYKKKNAEVVGGQREDPEPERSADAGAGGQQGGQLRRGDHGDAAGDDAKPDEGILWVALGDAQLGAADAAAKAAKAAGNSPTDPAIEAKYNDALLRIRRASNSTLLPRSQARRLRQPVTTSWDRHMARCGNAKESADAYEMAAKAHASQCCRMYYFNEAATLYNAGKLPEASAAADKAIAADPKKAEAYYIKGQALIPQATVDPKTQKIVAPPGCVEAYQTYLELAPDGPHAADVKGILEGIGAQVKSSYKAPKK